MLPPNTLRVKFLRHLHVPRAGGGAEGGDGGFGADLHGDYDAGCELVDVGLVVLDYAFVDFEEFGGGGAFEDEAVWGGGVRYQ